MESNFTNYLRLKHAPVKQEDDEDCSPTYFQWTADSTNLLLKLRFEDKRQIKFDDRSISRKELWDEISTEMYRIGGYQISGDVCDLKYRNMLHTYKKNRKKELKGVEPENIVWSYYLLFKQALEGNEDKETSQMSHTDEMEETNQAEETTSNNNSYSNKKIISNVKPELIEVPVTPTELRPPSARLCSKRFLSALQSQSSNQQQQQHSTPTSEPASKVKCLEERNQQPILTQTNLTNFELEECRVFGETVGIQLSLIKTPETRALAELKIQEILYAAKLSKLKE